MGTRILFLKIFLPVIILSCPGKSSAQNSAKTDSLIKTIMGSERLTELNDKGTTLILNGNFSAATQFYNREIDNDEGNKEAYFNRGAVSWITSDTLNACRDWSALLALGATAAFKLLDSKCHGSMTIEDEVIPKATYHRIFAMEKKDAKTVSLNTNATTMAEEMPEFPGGTTALISYLSHTIKYPLTAKEKKVQGTVYINFIVSSKGKILFPYIARGIGAGCDEEALRVIRNMPVWKPGMEKGKPVLVRYNIPVQFRLK